MSLLSKYQASAREGHIQEILHIFAFLDIKPILTLYINPKIPHLDYSLQKYSSEFKEYYRDAKEVIPHTMPRPRGRSVIKTEHTYASSGANKVTRRSQSGYILFVNRSPVKWMSKRQQIVETSALSSEFIALKKFIEDIEHLILKIRMFGIPLSEDQPPTIILCDNETV